MSPNMLVQYMIITSDGVVARIVVSHLGAFWRGQFVGLQAPRTVRRLPHNAAPAAAAQPSLPPADIPPPMTCLVP